MGQKWTVSNEEADLLARKGAVQYFKRLEPVQVLSKKSMRQRSSVVKAKTHIKMKRVNGTQTQQTTSSISFIEK